MPEQNKRADALRLLEEADSYLREIRAENLDGSEPALGELLDRIHNFHLAAKQQDTPPEAEPGTAYLVIQEGGSSSEDFFLHSHETAEDAESDRASCARAGYRTSEIIEIPAALDALSETFYGAVRSILKSVTDLDYAAQGVSIAAIPQTKREHLAREDSDVPGTYTATVFAGLSPEDMASAALDAFHSSIAVSVLDDFGFYAFDPDTGAALVESDGHESYSKKHLAWDVQKVSCEYPDFEKAPSAQRQKG